LHCGGKTLRGAESAAVEAIVGSAYESFGKTTAESSGVQESSPFPESEEQSGDSLFRLPEFRSDDREIEMAEEPKSIGKSLIQGLGGFVWIIVLIGFTLVRNCGGE
jgi:hypothetical protein